MGGADQRPLCLHGLKATQQELSKSSCPLDLPEHRLDDLLSQSVPAAITGALRAFDEVHVLAKLCFLADSCFVRKGVINAISPRWARRIRGTSIL